MSFFILSCKENREDKKWLEERLRKRSMEYENSFIKLDVKKMWDLSSEEFKKIMGNDKRKYINGVKEEGGAILAGFSSIEVLIEEVDIRGDKAIVKIKRIVQEKNDSKKDEDFIFDFWILENNDWYLVCPDRKSPIRVGWWGELKKIDEKDFTEREIQLKKRVMAYHDSLKNNEPEISWDLQCKERKNESSSKESFVKLRKSYRNRVALYNYIDFSVEAISVFEDIAEVKIKYLYKYNENSGHDSTKINERIFCDIWIFENNDWFLDTTRADSFY